MPGKLTKEEFETMKEHTLIGASMLDKLEHYKDEKMIKIAYQICRWHHERYDAFESLISSNRTESLIIPT